MVLARVLSIAVLFDRAAPGAQLFLAGPRVFGCSARPRRASSKCFSAHQSALLVNPASIRKTRWRKLEGTNHRNGRYRRLEPIAPRQRARRKRIGRL